MIVMGVGFVFSAALFAYWQVSSRPRDGAPSEQAPDTLRVALKDTAAPPQDSVPVQSVNKVPEYGPEKEPVTKEPKPETRRTEQNKRPEAPESERERPPPPPPPSPPDPVEQAESLLREASRFLGINSPGRAYRAATRAIDVAVSAQGQPGAPVAELEDVKNRAEKVSVISVQQCENTEDPNVNRRECP
jgi:hypothetical protein